MRVPKKHDTKVLFIYVVIMRRSFLRFTTLGEEKAKTAFEVPTTDVPA